MGNTIETRWPFEPGAGVVAKPTLSDAEDSVSNVSMKKLAVLATAQIGRGARIGRGRRLVKAPG